MTLLKIRNVQQTVAILASSWLQASPRCTDVPSTYARIKTLESTQSVAIYPRSSRSSNKPIFTEAVSLAYAGKDLALTEGAKTGRLSVF